MRYVKLVAEAVAPNLIFIGWLGKKITADFLLAFAAKIVLFTLLTIATWATVADDDMAVVTLTVFVTVTGWFAGKLLTLTVPLTGGKLSTLTVPLTGWVAGKLLMDIGSVTFTSDEYTFAILGSLEYDYVLRRCCYPIQRGVDIAI